LFWLKKYCQFLGVNPDSIISERSKQLESQEQLIRRKHEELFQQFSIKLQQDGYSLNSVSTATGLIRSFYKANYYPLVEVPTVRPYRVKPFKVPTTKDVKKMCEIADTSMTAWMLSQYNSGLGNTDLLSLRLDALSSEFGTIKTQLKKGIVPIHIEIRRQKSGEKVDSFFGSNAVEALNEYVNLDARGEIFRMSIRTIENTVKHLGIRAKVATEKVPITPYSFRRAFNTAMKLSGMNEALVERMMGHSIGRVRSAYLVTGEDMDITGIPISKLAEIYMQHYPALDITKV